MEDENSERPHCPIPERIFKSGEEPTGVRVTPYHKPCAIRQILNALDPDEVEQIRNSPFGKLVDIADKPSFSGRFGRYIISRQLKVAKKHEAWFVFAGKPIRFSLREFAFVTGLNCGKIRKRSKKRALKNNITEKPYWGELFGTLKEVPVSSVIRMLMKKTVTKTELRLKYAYLALLSSVILPTTHTPVSFYMLMSSIKERKEVSLSQNTIALKGFVLSLQLVMVEAVPALTEVVQDGSSSGSEDDFDVEEDNIDNGKGEKKSISPGHARDIDAAGKAMVHSLISGGDNLLNAGTEFVWSDDEEDSAVDNLLTLIEQQYPFFHSGFTGGVTKLDVIRLREEAKAGGLHRKTTKAKQGISTQIPVGFDVEFVGDVVKDKLKEDFKRLETQVATLQESSLSFQTMVLSNLSEMLGKFEVVNANIASLTRVAPPQTTIYSDGHPQRNEQPPSTKNVARETNVEIPTIIEEAVRFVNCVSSSSADEARVVVDELVNATAGGGEEACDGANITDINLGANEVALGCRKSKRQKVPPKALLGNYECDRRFLNRARQAVADSKNPGGNIDYSAKFSILLDKLKTPFCITTDAWTLESTELYEIVERENPISAKVVDVLISHISALYRGNSHRKHQSKCVFLDTKFVSQISKVYTKFSNVSRKDTFRFPDNIVENTAFIEADRFYFPFNLDKKYWIGICIDMSNWSIAVLDSNLPNRSEYMMGKEVKPIAQMFPYFAKQVGKQVGLKDMKALAFESPRFLPQNNAITDSAVTTILFIQAHAVAGVDACKCITAAVLDTEVERLVVTLYEGNVGPL
ncbi:hypothetical protein N665_0751s0014 [Sinapis alba]|nr:hypothetical protein N665_0751s0014 [Sinapis alba]